MNYLGQLAKKKGGHVFRVRRGCANHVGFILGMATEITKLFGLGSLLCSLIDHWLICVSIVSTCLCYEFSENFLDCNVNL